MREAFSFNPNISGDLEVAGFKRALNCV